MTCPITLHYSWLVALHCIIADVSNDTASLHATFPTGYLWDMANCETLHVSASGTLLCRLFSVFFGPHVIKIYGALVICDQRDRMIADEFPGNRNTKCMMQNCKMWPPSSSTIFLKILHWPESPDPRRQGCRNLCADKPMTEIYLWKRVKYRQKTKASPSSSQRGKKIIARYRPNYPNVDKSTLSRIGKCLRSNDEVTLEKMLCPSTYKRGQSTVLTSEEEAMLTERLIYAGKRGFAVGKDTLKSLMSRIASDGRPSWKDGVPSEDAIRAFRARHREITFRNAENKDRSKFSGRKLRSHWRVLQNFERPREK